MMTAFVTAGVVGLLAAAVLESWLVFGPGLLGMLKVGFIEEFVKRAAIVLLALGFRSYATRDGIVLGGAVGFGFAALRAAGTRSPRCLSFRDNTSDYRYRPSS